MQKYLGVLSSGRCSDAFDSGGWQQVWALRDNAANCNAQGAVNYYLQKLSIGTIISWDGSIDQEMMYLKMHEHPYTLVFPGWIWTKPTRKQNKQERGRESE